MTRLYLRLFSKKNNHFALTMNDKNPNSVKTSLLNDEDRELLEQSLRMGSEEEFGTSWMPLPQTELYYRYYREKGQLYFCLGRVQSDDTVEICSKDVLVGDCLKAIELEVKKLVQLR